MIAAFMNTKLNILKSRFWFKMSVCGGYYCCYYYYYFDYLIFEYLSWIFGQPNGIDKWGSNYARCCLYWHCSNALKESTITHLFSYEIGKIIGLTEPFSFRWATNLIENQFLIQPSLLKYQTKRGPPNIFKRKLKFYVHINIKVVEIY